MLNIFCSLDYLANNLYWIDHKKGTVEVYSLNQKKRTIVQHYAGTDKPTAMVLIPSRGEMFVALQSTDNNFHIDRQSMRGGHDHHHVVETGLSKKGPIHFAIDETAERLYWSDGDGRKIEFSDFNGMSRKTFAISNRAPGPLIIIGDDLLWTSLKSKSLQWSNKSGTGVVKIVTIDRPPTERKLPDLISMVAGTPLKVSNHPCMIKNGGCSDICISDGPLTRVCLCETGHLFKNNANTTCVKRTECGFRCSSGECLESSQRCDNKFDCLDKSDELKCEESKNKCDASEFKCRDGKCIPISQRCDQNFNCADQSDEADCSDANKKQHCRSGQMKCPSGLCIDISQRCDDHDDCGDGFDEREDLCQKIDCPKDFFKCISGQCIPKEFECNSYVDCVDASDEHAECRKSNESFMEFSIYTTFFLSNSTMRITTATLPEWMVHQSKTVLRWSRGL